MRRDMIAYPDFRAASMAFVKTYPVSVEMTDQNGKVTNDVQATVTGITLSDGTLSVAWGQTTSSERDRNGGDRNGDAAS